MAQFIGHLIRNHLGEGNQMVLRPRRTLAVAAIVALLVATMVAPTCAAAAEPDSEGEGSAPPGLENPHFEPGGEETALESLPGALEADEADEAGEAPPIETEPAQESELTEPSPAPEESAPPAAPPLPPPTETPSPAPSEYTPATPKYEAPSPPSAPVENDPIVAPPGASEPPPKPEGSPPQPEPEAAAPNAVAEAPPAVVPSSEPEVPAPEAPAPAPAPVAAAGSGGVSPPLRGRSSYTVRPGDCLWSIAEALLPRGVANDEIEAEIARLWRLNAARIGTGDPSLIFIGTQLALV